MDMTSRSCLVMKILCLLVCITVVCPPGLVYSVSASTTSLRPAEEGRAAWRVAEATPSAPSVTLAQDEDPVTPGVSPLETPPAPTLTGTPFPFSTAPATPTPVATEPPVPTPSPTPVTETPPWLAEAPTETATAIVAPQGGRIVVAEGRVTLDTPRDAVDRELELQLTLSSARSLDTASGGATAARIYRWLTLSVEAVDPARAVAGHVRFAEPLTLTFDMTGFPGWLTPYVVHAIDAESAEWEVLPSTYDGTAQTLVTHVERFSDVGVSGAEKFPSDGSAYLLTNTPDVNTFTGAATYAYDFQLPAGRRGLNPSLSLTYNSGSLNALMGVVQGNYVGVGWNLGGMIAIVRSIGSHPWEGHSTTYWEYKAEFDLLLGGAAHRLLGPEELANDGGCRYYAEDAPELLVMRYTVPGSSGQYCGYGPYSSSSVTNTSKEFWVVTQPDGTEHRLGSTLDSEQTAVMWPYSPSSCSSITAGYSGVCSGHWCSFGGYGGEGQGKVASRWSVDRTTDVYGNAIFYGYWEEDDIYHDGSDIHWDRAHYPDWLRYTGEASQPGSGAYLVDFIYEPRRAANDNSCSTCEWHDDGEAARAYRARDTWRLDRVRICGGVTGTTCPDNGSSMVEYDLDYQFVDESWPGLEWIINTIPHETTRLTSITRAGWSSSGAKQFLPATTFAYTTLAQADNVVDPGGKLVYPRLVTVNNGYGGSITLTYNSSGPYNHQGVYSYVTTRRRSNDGLGRTADTLYTYADPCFSSYNAWPNCRRSDADPNPSYGLIGHKSTTMTAYDYDGRELSRETQAFHVAQNVLQGKPYQTRTYEGSTLLLQQDSLWTIQKFGPPTLGATAGYVVQTQSVDTSGTPSARQRVETVYDAYGNPTATYTRGYVDGASVTVPTPGFEAGGNFGSWTAFWDPIPATITTGEAHSGQYALKLQHSTAQGGVWVDFAGLTAGQAYTIRAWVKGSLDATALFSFWLHDTTDANPHTSGWMAPDTVWRQIETTYVVPATGKMRLHLFFRPGSGAIYVDDITVTKAENRQNEQSIHRDYFNITASRWRVGLPYQEAVFEGNCRYDQIDVVFSNDAFINGQDRNLIVDYIVVGGTTIQAEGNSVKLDRGLGAAAFDGENVIAGQQTVAWNGALRVHTTAPYSTQQVSVRAYGTPADGIYPTMTLRINGQDVKSWAINGTYTTYTANVALNGCGRPAAQQFTYYDDTSYTETQWGVSSQIAKGAVTMSGASLLIDGQPFATQRLGYDAWGNIASTTDPRGYDSLTSYDGTYHMFPIQSCTPAISAGVGRLCSATTYYGVNPASLAGSYGLFGQVQRSYDSNGESAAVVYVYDAFGRTLKVVRPGDTVSLPTLEYAYADAYSSGGLQGLRVIELVRETSGSGANQPHIHFYDGLGRAVQVRSEQTDGATQAVVNTTYDALDRLWRQYAAAEEGFNWNFARPSGWDSRQRTTTLARAQEQSVRAPEGSTSTRYQVGRRSITLDANGHRRDSLTDARGRVVEVIEYSGAPQVYQAESWHHLIGSAQGSVWLSPAVGSGAN